MMTKKYLIKDNYNKPHMVSVISNQGTEKKPFEMFVHISSDISRYVGQQQLYVIRNKASKAL